MSNDRFLLIKAWSYILWTDVEHVLSQLLIAELTDRIPVVYWSTYCLHNGFAMTNGFELYFEPVSSYTVFDLARPEYTYFPPVWDSENLLADDYDRKSLYYRSLGEIMSSSANVVIGDTYIDIYSIIPFIRKNHPTYGMTERQISRFLYKKYIRVKADIQAEIQGFYNSWLKGGKPVLAVHIARKENDRIIDVTGSPKYNSQYYAKDSKKDFYKDPLKEEKKFKSHRRGKFKEPNEPYKAEIEKILDKNDIDRIFLVTDCQNTLEEYKKLYGQMLVYTDCKRLWEDDFVSQMENPMIKRQRGIEVVKDACLAAQCDFFIGNDFSNLSRAVEMMKEWPNGNIRLLYWLFKRRKYPVNARMYVNRGIKDAILDVARTVGRFSSNLIKAAGSKIKMRREEGRQA